MSEIITVGLDLAKNVFQVHGADASGLGVLRKKLRRDGGSQPLTARFQQFLHCFGRLCNDPVKICSCYREENSDEYDDGRQHQAVDGEAEDGAGHRDHSRQDDGGGSQSFLRSVTL